MFNLAPQTTVPITEISTPIGGITYTHTHAHAHTSVCVIIHRGVTTRMLVQVYVPGGHKCVCECMTPILGATCMIPAKSSRVYEFQIGLAVIVRTSQY